MIKNFDKYQAFRDQYDNPDNYPINASEIEEAQKTSQNNKQKEKNEDEQLETELSKNYKEIIDIISNFQLKSEFKEDAKELAILNDRKKIALEYLYDLLEKIYKYIGNVPDSSSLKRYDGEKIEKYHQRVKSSDSLRQSLHNTLIVQLKKTIKYINVNFNKNFPEDKRIRAEKKYINKKNIPDEEIKKSLDKKEYVNFKITGVIIDAEKMPRSKKEERIFIKNWAYQIYGEITKLEKEIKNIIK